VKKGLHTAGRSSKWQSGVSSEIAHPVHATAPDRVHSDVKPDELIREPQATAETHRGWIANPRFHRTAQ
jgi:hypothetical protein